MKIEKNNFIIYCNDNYCYVETIINLINERLPRIIDFFKIDYKEKITIKIYDDITEYKNNLEESFKKNAIYESKIQNKTVEPRKFANWMIANTEDGNLNMQSFQLVKNLEDFKDYTISEYCFNAVHEVVHLCQQKIKSDSPGWFWEALATYLGNPECQNEITEPFTLDDLNNFDNVYGYGMAYAIGKYLFTNFDDNYILELAKDNNKLFSEIPRIIEEINKITGEKRNKK